MQAPVSAREKLKVYFDGLRASLGALTRFQAAIIIGLVALTALGGVVAFVRSRPRQVAVKERGSTQSRSRSLAVHVAGAVAMPGLYDLKEGSRVADAVSAAGGASPDAALDGVNLAARLKDGEKVMVPRAVMSSVPAASPVSENSTTLVNLNTASEQEMEELPGVGPALSKRIVQYREKNGAFSSVDELDNVEGIGPRKLETLEGLVTI